MLAMSVDIKVCTLQNKPELMRTRNCSLPGNFTEYAGHPEYPQTKLRVCLCLLDVHIRF